eukprot:g40757.t1
MLNVVSFLLVLLGHAAPLGSLRWNQKQARSGEALEVPAWAAVQSFDWGQVSGVGVSREGDVYAFHRGARRWGANTFQADDRLSDPSPLPNPAILKLNAQTGAVEASWGQGLFHLPHSLTIVQEPNGSQTLWLTDVGSHLALKYTLDGQLLLSLGTPLTPGLSPKHFCKPTDVAVDPCQGTVFVSDGYCNGRVVAFSATGQYLRELGGRSHTYPFVIAHSVVLEGCGERARVFVADRENDRIQVFQQDGTFVELLETPGKPYALTLLHTDPPRLVVALLMGRGGSALAYTKLHELQTAHHNRHLWHPITQNTSNVKTLFHDLDATLPAGHNKGAVYMVVADINPGMFLHKFEVNFYDTDKVLL